MRHYQIAVLPGDGIGPEVIAESVQTLGVLAQLHGGFQLDVQQFDWGTEHYLREGAMMPKDGLSVLEQGGKYLYWFETGAQDRLRISLARSPDAHTWAAEPACAVA